MGRPWEQYEGQDQRCPCEYKYLIGIFYEFDFHKTPRVHHCWFGELSRSLHFSRDYRNISINYAALSRNKQKKDVILKIEDKSSMVLDGTLGDKQD